jgi:hypothetical protein
MSCYHAAVGRPNIDLAVSDHRDQEHEGAVASIVVSRPGSGSKLIKGDEM